MFFADAFTVIANPRTGSTSVYNTLANAGYGLPLGQRHVPPHYLPAQPTRSFVCTVRHPAHRLVSAWAYFDRTKEPFSEWLRGMPQWFGSIDIKRTSQAYWCSEKIEIVMRFETLEQDWRNLLERFSLPFTPLLKERSSKHPHYSEVVSKDDMVLIEDRFHYDFERWNY